MCKLLPNIKMSVSTYGKAYVQYKQFLNMQFWNCFVNKYGATYKQTEEGAEKGGWIMKRIRLGHEGNMATGV